MENWKKNSRKDIVMVDVDALVPQDHLLRKIETVMDYEWLYERLEPYYCHDNGRPGTDPVVLIKMVLIQHLFGIPSLRQTYREIQVNVAYRWFLGYGLLDNIPHFATVSYAFCQRFPDELTSEIFEHILNKALNNRMLDTSAIFIDGTHIKASANKKKFQKEQVAKAARVYSGQLRREVNAEREKLGSGLFRAIGRALKKLRIFADESAPSANLHASPKFVANNPTRKYGKFRIRSFFIFLLSITDHAPVSSLEPSSESLRQFP